MGNIIDISAKITNQLPVVKITDELVVTVNNRKSVVLNVQLLVKEVEAKAQKGESVDDNDFRDKALTMLIGEKNVKTLNEMDLPTPEYKMVFDTIMGAATGTYNDATPSKQ